MTFLTSYSLASLRGLIIATLCLGPFWGTCQSDNMDCEIDYTLEVVDAPCFDDLGTVGINYAGDAPLQLNWSSGEVDVLQVNLLAGEYFVTLSDTTGCEIVDTFVVGEPEKIRAEFVLRNSACDGRLEITAEPVGGFPPYQVQWIDPLNVMGPDVTIETSGTYPLVVLDSRGCFQFDTLTANFSTLGQNELNLTATTFCDTSLAFLSAELSTIDSTYQVAWSSGALGFNDTVSTPGWYSFSVRDTFDCLLEDSIFIAPPLSLSLQDSINPMDGSVILSATIIGGIPPYTFTWSTGAMDSNILVTNSGWYYLSLSDANACEGVDSIEILMVNIQDPTASAPVRLFPNPHQGHFNLQFPSELLGEWELRLYGSDGRLYREERRNRVEETMAFDWSELPAGLYFLYWKSADRVGSIPWKKE